MWLTQVESEGHGLVENAPLSAEEQGDEFLLMGLRLREGIDFARFAALSGRSLRRRQINDLVAEGFIEEDARGRIRVTSTGMPLLDSVVADLAAWRSALFSSRTLFSTSCERSEDFQIGLAGLGWIASRRSR